MLQPLNFFAPYKDLPGHHENQLTRALLVVLRYSPMCHAAWLNLVDAKLRLEKLPATTFRTQEARARKGSSQDPDASVRGISVFLTPDHTPHVAGSVQAASRVQILDAIVEYGDDLVVVVENKIAFGVQTTQPTAINTHNANIKFDRKVRHVSWQSLLEVFADIAARSIVSGPEMAVLEDFLEFVEHFFPQVGPYSTLRRAASSIDRVTRRLDVVLASAVGVADRPGQGTGWRDLPEPKDGRPRAVEMVKLGLEPASNRVVLQLYPGDTLTQARVLYSRPDAVRGLLNLVGWATNTNYHWGFMTSGYCWTPGNLAVPSYIEFWINRIGRTAAIPRPKWAAAWDELTDASVVRANDRIDFDLRFTNTKIPTATPRPGLMCERAWSMTEAMELDDRGHFVTTVRGEIQRLLGQLQEPEIPTQMPHP